MPDLEKSLTLVVPVYNEEERAAESFDALCSYMEGWPKGSRLIFVDDGSVDLTLAMLRARAAAYGGPCSVEVLARPHRGKGATVRDGLLAADTDVAAFCDVDLATPLDELDRIIQTAIKTEGLAIGSRSLPDANLVRRESFKREMAGRIFNRFVQIAACPGIFDTQCGAKAAPTSAWRALLLHSIEDGFAWDVEVVAAAIRGHVEVTEMAIRWSHDDRSRVNVMSDGMKMVRAVSKIRFRTMRDHAPSRPLVKGRERENVQV
jgi:dolichyl-phosphate beta-glucosyltransferase